MIDAVVEEPMPGFRVLKLIRQVGADGRPVEDVTIPLAAIAFRREALGMDDPAEVVESFIYSADHGEPECDPVTGENAWTECYALLRLREQAREDEAARAVEDGDDHEVVVERSEKAAYDAVHVPVNGGECPLDRGRRVARGKLGLPDPAKKAGPETRTKKPERPEPRGLELRNMRPPGGKARALDLLAEQTDHLHACTKRFLHSLTDRDTDPLEPTPEPVSTLLTPEQTLAKYQEANDD